MATIKRINKKTDGDAAAQPSVAVDVSESVAAEAADPTPQVAQVEPEQAPAQPAEPPKARRRKAPKAERPYGEGLTKTIAFRVSDDEYQDFDGKCEQAGLSKSEFFRAAILGAAVTIQAPRRPAKSPDYRKAESQIRRAGNNINQIAHTLNTAALAGEIADRHAAAAVVMLAKIRRELRAAIEQE